MIPIIDTHQHLWDLNQFTLPWLADAPPLQNSYLTSDYLEATKDSNVAKAVYMEVDVTPSEQVAEAEYLISLCESDDYPTVGAVIGGNPGTDHFNEYITQFKDSAAIKGIRQVLHVPDAYPGFCLQDAFVRDVQLLGTLGKSFDICIRPSELGDAVKLVDLCPDTQFILDHCGNADPNVVNGSVTLEVGEENPFAHTREQWMDDISALGERANVVGKISGIVARTQPGWTAADLAPTINHCLDAFGPDRVVFGGDWPVCTLGATYAEWAAALREVIATRSEEDQRKLLYDNAERLYKLG